MRLLSFLGIVGIHSSPSSPSSSSPNEDTKIEITNFTMVNFCLRVFGPKHEATLTSILLGIQVWPMKFIPNPPGISSSQIAVA